MVSKKRNKDPKAAQNLACPALDEYKQLLLDTSRDSIMLLDKELKIIWANHAAVKNSNKQSINELIGNYCYDLFAENIKPCRGCPCIEAIETGRTISNILRYPDKKNGHIAYWDHYAHPIKDADDNVECLAVTTRNVTDRAKLENELVYFARFRNIITSVSSQFINLHAHQIDTGINNALKAIGNFSNVDRAYVFQVNRNTGDLIKTHVWRTRGIRRELDTLSELGGNKFPWWQSQLHKRQEIFIPNTNDITEDAKGLKQFLVKNKIKSILAIPLTSEHEVLGFIGFDIVRDDRPLSSKIIEPLKIIGGIFSNLLERKRRDEEIQQSEERLKLAMHATGLGLWSLNCLNGELAIDSQDNRIIGYDIASLDPKIKHWEQRIHPNDKVRLFDALGAHLDGDNPFFEAEFRLLDASDEWKWLFISGKIVEWIENNTPSLMLGTYRDMTEQKIQERELRMSQKMEAIGTLAGGISHNFNNILTGIIGYAKLSLFNTDESNPIHKNLEEIVRAGRRAADLVSQIQTFSRQAEQERIPMLLQPLIKESLKMLRETFPSTIKIKHNISPDCGPVLADVSQVHQVIMNLCTNAYSAMHATGGTLDVEFKKIKITARSLAKHPDLPVGDYAMLVVKDTGHGMDKKTQERIFEPYFTTKKGDEGSGLGLATVHGILTSSGGTITVKSAEGKGATFNAYWPILSTPEEKIPESKRHHLPTIDKTILFVDDEEMLVKLGELILKQIGCGVVATTSSIRALKAFKVNPDKFDMVFTDLTMPEMTGFELSEEILKIKPGIPIILSSGYNEPVNMDKAKEIGIKEFIKKPLAIEEITEIIWKVLSDNN